MAIHLIDLVGAEPWGISSGGSLTLFTREEADAEDAAIADGDPALRARVLAAMKGALRDGDHELVGGEVDPTRLAEEAAETFGLYLNDEACTIPEWVFEASLEAATWWCDEDEDEEEPESESAPSSADRESARRWMEAALVERTGNYTLGGHLNAAFLADDCADNLGLWTERESEQTPEWLYDLACEVVASADDGDDEGEE